jgi:rod shape-determining protein MreB
VYNSINATIKQIIDSVRRVLEEIPPEVASDIHDRGLTLTGGMSLLAGMDARIGEAIRLKVDIAESPRQSVGRGAIALFDQPLLLRRIARNVEMA